MYLSAIIRDASIFHRQLLAQWPTTGQGSEAKRRWNSQLHVGTFYPYPSSSGSGIIVEEVEERM